MGTLYVGSFPGLYEALAARVAEIKADDPLAPVTVVVGSGAVARRLPRTLATSLGDLANVRVTTVYALARDLASAAVGSGATPAADMNALTSGSPVGSAARQRLVAGVVASLAERGDRFWASVREFPGVPSALLRSVDDLRLGRVAAPLVQGEAGSDRVRAVGAALADYETELERRGVADDAAVYERAAAAIDAGCAWPSDRGAVCVFGLYDFPERQAVVLERLLGLSGGDVFLPAATSGGGFAHAAEERLGASVGGRRDLASPAVDTDLATLQDRVFREPPPTTEALLRGDGSLAILSVADESAEIRAAAQELLAAAEDGLAFCEMAVVAPDAARCRRIAGLLEESGIPAAGRRRRYDTAIAALAAVLDCLAPPTGVAYGRRAVLQLAAVAVAAGTLAPDVVARWASESRAAGVVGGADGWRDRLAARARSCAGRVHRLRDEQLLPGEEDGDGGADAQRLAEAKAALDAVRQLERFVATLLDEGGALAAAGSWPDHVEQIVELVVRCCGLDPSACLEDVRALGALDAVEETVDLQTVVASMRRHLAEAEETRGELGRSGVAVLRPETLRGLTFETVVFTGLCEGGFPVRPRQDPLLLDDERRKLADQAGTSLPLAAEREAEDRLLFALALAAAGRRLVLIIPRGEAHSGKPRMPSRTAVRVCESLAGRPVGLADFADADFLPDVFRRVPSGERGLPLDLRDRDLEVLSVSTTGGACVAGEFFATLHGEIAAERIRRRRAAALSPDPAQWDAVLSSREALAALRVVDPLGGPVSPSAIEEYIRCPFRFYLSRVLGLQIPEDVEEIMVIEPKDRGIVSHAVLERVFGEVASGDRDRRAAVEAVDEAAAEQFAEAEERGVTGLPSVWRLVQEEILADLREAVAGDPVWDEDGLRPAWFEYSFGVDPGPEVGLDISEGRRVRFKGRMDRVDIAPDDSRVRVVDYKTGNGSAERDKVRQGLSVQLAVYALAAQALARSEGLGPVAVQSMYRFVSRRGGFATLALDQSSEAALERLKAVVETVTELVSGGLFMRSPRDPGWVCRNCDVGYACDDTDWARVRKRESDEAAPLVCLQDPRRAAAGDDAAGSAQTGSQDSRSREGENA